MQRQWGVHFRNHIASLGQCEAYATFRAGMHHRLAVSSLQPRHVSLKSFGKVTLSSNSFVFLAEIAELTGACGMTRIRVMNSDKP